jgi:hypothetical protein
VERGLSERACSQSHTPAQAAQHRAARVLSVGVGHNVDYTSAYEREGGEPILDHNVVVLS